LLYNSHEGCNESNRFHQIPVGEKQCGHGQSLIALDQFSIVDCETIVFAKRSDQA
jgi:hypothetical protein